MEGPDTNTVGLHVVRDENAAAPPLRKDAPSQSLRFKIIQGDGTPSTYGTSAPETMEVKHIIRQIGDTQRAKDVNKILTELDRNADGTIDVNEMVNMLEGVVKSRRERRYLWIMFIVLSVFALAMVGSIVGLTYAVMDAMKDTEVSGDTMFVKGSTVDVVRVGSAEFAVENGALVHRMAASNPTNTTIAAIPSSTTAAGPVLQVASYIGTPQAFTSEVDVRTLLELKYLYIKGTGNIEMGLMVTGVARLPLVGSIYGTVVRILTTAGTITLDGTVITFSTHVADIFAEAGFSVSRNRRVLIGAYNVMGFFNTIKDLSAFNLPENQPKPQLPSENFMMKLKIYEQCQLPDPNFPDRCVYYPPESPASDGSFESSELPPSSPVDSQLSNRRSTLALHPDRRRLRHRFLATTPHRRSLGGSYLGGEDLAGVEILDGVRFMTHNETSIVYNGFTRVLYDFALYPAYRKIEVTRPDVNAIFDWQEDVLPIDSSNDVHTYFCRNYTKPAAASTSSFSSSVLSFDYLGVDSIGDRLARHFRLTTSQQSVVSSTMSIDYWDAIDTQAPLRFEYAHADIGRVRLDVLEFRSIDANSPEAAPSMFVQPALAECPTRTSIPRLSSPFSVSGPALPASMVEESSRHRQLGEVSGELVKVWEQLDHVNGTGEWPQWALDMYGGVNPVDMRHHGRTLMATDCGKTTLDLAATFKPCNFKFKFYAEPLWAVTFACSGNWGPVTIEGSITGDLCRNVFQGCIALGAGLSEGNWLRKKIGVDSVDIAEICVGFDAEDRAGFLSTTIVVNGLIGKGEASALLKFSSCCTWAEEVKIEGFLGLGWGDYGIWHSVGEYVFMKDVYLRGSPSSQSSYTNPTISNQVGGWRTVAEGWWGDWQEPVVCGAITYSMDKTSITGRPMASFWLRIEKRQESADDTALNGVKVGCLDGTTLTATNGFWGDWYGPAKCPNGGYFTGARVRVESNQRDQDDTAANSVVFRCNNAASDLNVHSGFWGDWSPYTYCPSNTYICGVQARLERNQGGNDDTSMNGLRIACCSFPTAG